MHFYNEFEKENKKINDDEKFQYYYKSRNIYENFK